VSITNELPRGGSWLNPAAAVGSLILWMALCRKRWGQVTKRLALVCVHASVEEVVHVFS
jgi:hypothetical protein